MRILVNHNGQQLGPFSLDEVRAALAAGRFFPTDLVRTDAEDRWIPLSSLPGLSGPIGITAPPQTTSSLAITSLVLGVFSVFCCAIFTGLPAVICGHMSLGQIGRSRGTIGGQGYAIGGLITGYVGIIFSSAMMLAIFLPAFTAARQSAKSSMSLQEARQIYSACNAYAASHGGKYPATLEDLVPEFLPDRSKLADPSLTGSTEIGYYYYGSGQSQGEMKEEAVFLASKATYVHGKRAVVHANGMIQAEIFTPPTD